MSLKRTPLYEHHRKLGARFVEFSGWEMPLHYTSVIEEHRAVRQNVGVFDISHMGQIEIRGGDALDLVQHLIPNDAARLDADQALYTPLCNEEGGTLDDLLVYRLPDRFLLVVNAATTGRGVRWIRRDARRFRNVEVKNASRDYALLAVQGPHAEKTLRDRVPVDLSRVQAFRAVETELEKEPALISRTGYTGEDGFEIYGAPDLIVQLWIELIKAGVSPIGLGARDSLRFEAGLPLYDHELDEETTPVEAGLGWTVKDKPDDYLGKAVLLRQKREGVNKRLVGFRMREPGVPRQGYTLFRDGEEAGYVTSGMKAPTLDSFLGMGYLRGSKAPAAGTEIEVEIHGRPRRAEIVKLPFYRRPER